MSKTGRSNAAKKDKRAEAGTPGSAKRSASGKRFEPADSAGSTGDGKVAASKSKRRSTKSAGSDKVAAAVRRAEAAALGAAGKGKTRKKARGSKLKTSVYLERAQAQRLARLSKDLGKPQAEIVREAIETYEPPRGGDRNFALARGFGRIDKDPRPISEIPEAELLGGFGE